MKEITSTRELQQIEFGILCDIDRFCRELGIRYFLCGGTLLGAVRHKGFIPWDDDIDIGMLRPDYDRFLREYRSDRHRLAWHGNDPTYFFPFAKVVDERTFLVDRDFPRSRIGVYVDVFPFDETEDDPGICARAARRMEWVNRALTLRNIALFRKGRPFPRQALALAGTALRLFPNRWLLDWHARRNARPCRSEKRKIACFSSTNVYGTKDVHPAAAFDGFVDVPFEGGSFPAMRGWRDYLTDLYGDFMKLPPEEKRISHHNFRAWWKN